VVLGPHTVGGKDLLPGRSRRWAASSTASCAGCRCPCRRPCPDLPLQLIHEDDVGQALLQCVVAAGPPGAYNIAADDVVSAVDVARELGFVVLPVPARPVRAAARAFVKLPLLPSAFQWAEAATQPAVMDTTKAKEQLGWTPRYSALEALRDTLKK
jgi:nucleoside-diphosphate-sugar epimerase